MVETITPVVHGGRTGRWARSVLLHALGTTIAAATFGAALGVAGAATAAPWGRGGLVVLAAVALAYVAREWFRVPVPIPQRRRQVPQWWREAYPPPFASFLYGLGLGIGFLTFLSYGTFVAVALVAAATGSPSSGALIVGAFGLARGLSVFLVARGRTQAHVDRTVARLDELAIGPGPRAANGAALAILAAAVLAAASAAAVTGEPGRLAAAVLAVVFAWAATAKAAAPGRWREALRPYGLPGALEAAVAVAVPAGEAALVVLLLAGPARLAGVLALGALAAFTAAILVARRRVGDRVPCGCFGRKRARDWRSLVGRNAALAAAAAVVVATGARAPVPDLPKLGAGDWIPASLAAAGAVLAAVALVRAASLFAQARGGRRADPA